jgi:uncharacterized protein YndB with AHSA1/START domain
VAGPYRNQALIEAPVEEVWELIRNPNSHPDWWPDVVAAEGPEELAEGDEYTRKSKLLPFVDAVDSVWVAERMEHMKEAQFRCTVSGSFARFRLTPAQDDTFVELESGMDPTTLRWRIMNALSASYLKNWIMDTLDAIPNALAARRKTRR